MAAHRSMPKACSARALARASVRSKLQFQRHDGTSRARSGVNNAARWGVRHRREVRAKVDGRGSAAFLAAASERGNAMPEPRSNRGNGAQAASYYENPEPTYPPPWPLRRFLYVWEPVSPDDSHPEKPASPAAYPGTGFLRGKYFLSANPDRRGDLTPGNSRGDRRPDVTGEHIGCHNRGRSRCGRRADRRTANGVEIHAVIACL